MINSAIIREGRIEDEGAAGTLIWEAGGSLMDFMTGAETREATETCLAGLWSRGANRFGHEFGRVAESEGRAVGLLIGYPAGLMAGLDLATGRGLLAERGIGFLQNVLRHPFRTLALAALREAEPGEWYVCVLATDPAFRGRGIGTALLGEAEESARGSGASALSLIVAEEKSPARALYAKCGFLERGRAAAGGHASIRMAKAL